MQNNSKRDTIRNFDFVPFFYEPYTEYVTEIKNRNIGKSGYIELRITTLDNLYLGSGHCRFENNMLFNETLTEDKKLVIPGSSLKGAVRQISRAVSDGCIPVMNEKKNTVCLDDKYEGKRCKIILHTDDKDDNDRKNKSSNICIVCDMYGMMGLASKVIFSDFTAEKSRTDIINVPKQYTPNIKSPTYKDDEKHKGYKFYNTVCKKKSDSCDNIIEAVSKGVEFRGRVSFKHLCEEQVELLMYSLGLSKTFGMKLGGYKSIGLGTVQVDCEKFVLNNEEADAKEYADGYREKVDYEEQFAALERIMKYDKRWEKYGKK